MRNPESIARQRQKTREWFANHPNYNRDWVKAHPGVLAARHRFKKYGITESQYQAMLAEQEGRCAVCRRTNTERPLGVDHDHATGRVRGLLCNNCNTKLGWLERFTPVIDKYLGG